MQSTPKREQVQGRTMDFGSSFFTTGVFMKSVGKFVGAVVAGLVATCGVALANTGFNVPEPGSIALAGVGIAALVFFSRKKK